MAHDFGFLDEEELREGIEAIDRLLSNGRTIKLWPDITKRSKEELLPFCFRIHGPIRRALSECKDESEIRAVRRTLKSMARNSKKKEDVFIKKIFSGNLHGIPRAYACILELARDSECMAEWKDLDKSARIARAAKDYNVSGRKASAISKLNTAEELVAYVGRCTGGKA